MAARHRYCVVLVLGSLGSGSFLWALPPCGPPGTITTVTAPDGGDYIAAFRDYKIYPSEYLSVGGGVDLVAAPDYRSYYPQNLALGPQGRVHVADMTIIYRLEDDGSATRIVGVPQYSTQEDDAQGLAGPPATRGPTFCRTRWRPWRRALPRGRWPSTGRAGSTSSTMSTGEGIRGRRPASRGSKRTGR